MDSSQVQLFHADIAHMFRETIFRANQLPEEIGTRQRLNKAVKNGTVKRISHNWYATEHAPPDVVYGLQKDVRLTCVSAAKHHGIYTPLFNGFHVYSVHSRCNTYLSSSYITHPSPYLDKWPDDNPIAPLDLTLLHAGRCLPVAEAAILFESALNLGKILPGDALAIIDKLPGNRRRSLSRIRSDAQSGTETMVRWFLESKRIRVQSQVVIPRVGRIDLLVGESLVIECDSVSYHTSIDQYHKDRYRDQELIRQGYQPLHLTWEDVFLRWESTEQFLLALISTRRQRALRPI